MKNKIVKAFYGSIAAMLFAGVLTPVTVMAEGYTGWKEDNGSLYWYENDVKQGTEGRGKEIYDPDFDAWYWLDAVDDGKMATCKDLYQESDAGEWAENKKTGKGKWVRYDEDGHMVKGWYTNENGTYYFDYTYGTMAKGTVNIDGVFYSFDNATGILQSEDNAGTDSNTNGWIVIDGAEYWYEKGVRQGTQGRGKEIFDSSSNAWYWLDAIDGGRKAVSKDVYQESEAGQWADREDGTGKWVRYDDNGHMIKGWSEKDGNKYYFDTIYGTMAKGKVEIDGTTYYFDKQTGIMEDNTNQKSKGEELFFARGGKVENIMEKVPYIKTSHGEDWIVSLSYYCDVYDNPKYVTLNIDNGIESYNCKTTYEQYVEWVKGYKEWILENDYNYNSYFMYGVLNPVFNYNANGVNTVKDFKWPSWKWRFEKE